MASGKKHILVIDESQLLRGYLKRKLEDYGFEVSIAVSGLDGASKIRNLMPDLIITELNLSRKNAIEMLEEKMENPNAQGIPTIVASAKLDRDTVMKVAPFSIRKFLTKPIRIDALLKAVGEVLNVPLALDDTPCVIEAHVNEEILFLEIAQGLNREKIELLRYKIKELMDLYGLANPKVLAIMTSISQEAADTVKLNALFNSIVESTEAVKKHIKVLTNNKIIKEFVAFRPEFSGIEVTSNLEKAMDGLLPKKPQPQDGPILEQKSESRQDIVTRSDQRKSKGKQETIDLKFQHETSGQFALSSLGSEVRMVVVDDDQVIQELIKTAFSDTQFQIKPFNNGREFVEGLEDMQDNLPDLVFLDLMMPEMDGFQVLMHLRKNGPRLPIIVLSALSKRETVIQALKLGVSSYMIKPLKPDKLRRKASEVLQLNF